MLSDLLRQAREDRPLWLPQLRAAFLEDESARPLTLRLTAHDGTQRDFPCALPRWESAEERQFAAEYLYACVYNILAVYSGRELRLYFDMSDRELCALYDTLDTVFQLGEAKRRGYGKPVSIASRIVGYRTISISSKSDAKRRKHTHGCYSNTIKTMSQT